MVRLVRRRRIQVKTTTNGSLLDVARRKELLTCGLTRVDIPIDGATAATHEALRPGSNFDEIIDNVAALVRERGVARTPQIRLWGVQQEANREEMPLLKQLGRRLGVDDVGVQVGMTNFGNPEMENSLQSLRVRTGDLQSDPACLRKLCRWPWCRTFISRGGFVGPCCLVSDPDVVSFGNVFDQGFAAIWHSEGYQALRSSLAEGHPPHYCVLACGLPAAPVTQQL